MTTRKYLELIRSTATRSLQVKDGYIYGSIADFLLREGALYPFAPLPRGVPQLVPKLCFANARILMKLFPDRFYYAEGYAAGVLPVHHAWCIDATTGMVVDSTWTRPGVEYFGVVFRTSYLLREDAKGGESGSLIDNWQDNWPLLKIADRSVWQAPITWENRNDLA